MATAFERFAEAVSNLDAREDIHLKDYLVRTKTYKSIFDNPRKIDLVVGLKGSGKSALYRTLTDDDSTNTGGKTIRIGISPADATWIQESQKVNLLQFSESAKTGLALYILRHIAENVDSLPDRAKIRNEILKPLNMIFERVKSLQGFSIFGCGVTWKAPDGTEGHFKRIPKEQASTAITLLQKLVSAEFEIHVVTDDADRIFGGRRSISIS